MKEVGKTGEMGCTRREEAKQKVLGVGTSGGRLETGPHVSTWEPRGPLPTARSRALRPRPPGAGAPHRDGGGPGTTASAGGDLAGEAGLGWGKGQGCGSRTWKFPVLELGRRHS